MIWRLHSARTMVAPLAWTFWFAVMLGLRALSFGAAGLPGVERLAASVPFAVMNTIVLAIVLHLVARFPIVGDRARYHLAVHALGAACLAVAGVALDRAVRVVFPVPPVLSWPVSVLLAMLNYALLAGAVHALEYARRYRRGELRDLQLRARLAATEHQRAMAELRALKAELNPHMLGNALHSVGTLLTDDPNAAQRILHQLTDLMHGALARVGHEEVSLGEELAALEPFLAIERTRLGGALTVEWDIDAEALAVRVPSMLLQPLIENAVAHGVAPNGGGRLTISARIVREAQDWMEIDVADDGVGLAAGASGLWRVGMALGVGMSHSRARLRELHGPEARIALVSNPDGRGACSRIRFPLAVRGAEWEGSPHPDGVGLSPTLHDGAADGATAPSSPRPASSRWRRLLPLAGFLLAAALLGRIARDVPLADGRYPSLVGATKEGLATAAIWTAILSIAIWAARRYPLGVGRMRRHLAEQAMVMIAVVLITVAGKGLVTIVLGYPGPAFGGSRMLLGFGSYVAFYLLISGVVHAVEFAARLRDAEAARLRLHVDLQEASRRRAEAALRALKTELNPQLYVSAFTTISSLLERDPVAAVRLITHLGDLVRDAVARTATLEVSLEEELASLTPFLAIERARAGGELLVEWEVAPDLMDARVPHLILPPLMQSTLWPEPQSAGRSAITVAASRHGERLELTVHRRLLPDSERAASEEVQRDVAGPSPANSSTPHAALTNTRERLAELYGDDAEVALDAASGGGVVARVWLPFMEVDESPLFRMRPRV